MAPSPFCNYRSEQDGDANSKALNLLGDFIKIRWVVASAQLLVLLPAYLGLLRNNPILPPVLATASLWLLVAASNLLIPLLAAANISPRLLLGAAFVVDILANSLLFAVTGGVDNPFILVLLAYIALSAMLLGGGWSWAVTILTIVIYRVLFIFSEQSVAPSYRDYLTWISFSFTALLIAYFVGKVLYTLRSREYQLRVASEELNRQNQLSSLATLAAGAAHELATPLGTIAIIAGELERSAQQDQALSRDIKTIRAEIARCRSILDRMAGHNITDEAENVTLGELAFQLKGRFGERYPLNVEHDPRGETLAITLPLTSWLMAAEVLIKNAAEAVNYRDVVNVTLKLDGNKFLFGVYDKGEGISSEALSHIGEPFFSTKEPGSGMGLGLFLVHSIARKLGGHFRIRSLPKEGTAAELVVNVSPPAGEEIFYHE